MQCQKCQAENPEGKKFCRKCGARLSLTCPECGAEIVSGDRFCGECGQDLEEPAEAAPVAYDRPHSYTPKHLADKILTTRSSMEGERKLVTVVFADVADFTAMSEKLDPEEVHDIMDGCFRILMEEIHRYEGTINQFTGDGVMALFGAPVAHEDHAQRACRAALSIQKALEEYGDRVNKDYGVEFRMRMGLNSGPVIVGAIGDDLRMDYTAVGDTTNLASRMEGLARPGSVVVSRNTHRLAREYFEFESLGRVEVKGKEEPQQRRERTFEALRDLVIRECQDRPPVMVIEDLHWIDKTSEDFLAYLIGWLTNARILLILLYRPEYTHPWGSKSYYNRIGVDQLTTRSSGELVQAILEGTEVEAELKELILNRAAGNPLFMKELTHSLLENGSIERREDRYVLNRKSSELPVPDTVQGIIAARIDRLEESLKRIMQVASVIGREFAFRILQTITGMREELKSHLLNLQGLEFTHEKTLFPELEYIFKHALTQEVAYNSLLAQRRKEIHEKIGRAMEEIYPDRREEFCEILAHHNVLSGNREKAVEYLELTNRKAAHKDAAHEAVDHFTKTMAVCDEIGAENELALALAGLGRLHKKEGNISEAREHLTRALEIFERLGTLLEPDKVREELDGLPRG